MLIVVGFCMADFEGVGDLEAPGALATAARRLATSYNELVMVASGPDQTSIQMVNNTLVSLQGVGLRNHTLLLADSWLTCRAHLPAPCFWSSRVQRRPAAESEVLKKFWDWRFRFYYVKKRYLAELVRLGFAVIQADSDTVCVPAHSSRGCATCHNLIAEMRERVRASA